MSDFRFRLAEFYRTLEDDGVLQDFIQSMIPVLGVEGVVMDLEARGYDI